MQVANLPWWLDPKITIGNIVSTALIIAGFAYGYSELVATTRQTIGHTVRLEKQDEDFRVQMSSLRTEISALRENSNTRQFEVVTKLARIEAILERVERSQSSGPNNSGR